MTRGIAVGHIGLADQNVLVSDQSLTLVGHNVEIFSKSKLITSTNHNRNKQRDQNS